MTSEKASKLRSRAWFDNPENIDMTALYLERYLNFGLSLEELRSGKPIIGIAQTGSDLSPCNRHHLVLAERVREGIREAGGIAFEFPVHPIQETGKRPTAALDRNLAYLSLVEVLHGYPIDGVVLTTGCDKTTPAMLMANSVPTARNTAQPRCFMCSGRRWRALTRLISIGTPDRFRAGNTSTPPPANCGWPSKPCTRLAAWFRLVNRASPARCGN